MSWAFKVFAYKLVIVNVIVQMLEVVLSRAVGLVTLLRVNESSKDVNILSFLKFVIENSSFLSRYYDASGSHFSHSCVLLSNNTNILS